MPQESAQERFLKLSQQYRAKYEGAAPPESTGRPLEGDLTASGQEGAPQLPPTPPQALEKPPGTPPHLNKVGRSPGEAIKDAFVNAPQSAFKQVQGVGELAKGLFWDLPKVVWWKYAGVPTYTDPRTGRERESEGPKRSVENFNRFLKDPQAPVKAVAQYYKDYYSNFTDSFAEDPFQFITDLSAVASPVAGVGRKLAVNAAKGSTLEKVAGALTKADKASRYVDPIQWTFKGANAALKTFGRPLADAMGMGSHTPAMMEIEKSLRSRSELEAIADLQRVANTPVSEEVGRLWTKAAFWGDEASVEAAKAHPQIKTFLDEVVPMQEDFMTVMNGMKDETAWKALAKGKVEYSKKFFGVDPDVPKVLTMEEALQMTYHPKLNPTGAHKPSYTTLFSSDKHQMSILERLHDTASEGKSLSRLERRAGGGEYLWDPNIVIPRMIKAFHRTKFRRDLLDSTVQYFMREAPGDLRFLPSNGHPDDLLAAGFSELPKDIWDKYLGDSSKVQAALLQNALRGDLNPDMVARVKKAYDTFVKRGKFRPPSGTRIFLPNHAVNFLKLVINPPTPMARLYDRATGFVKVAQTLWNPTFYPANVWGDSVIASFYGVRPSAYLRKGGYIAPELRALIEPEHVVAAMGPMGRMTNKLGHMAQAIDTMYKAGIFNEAAYRKLKDYERVAGRAFASMDELISFIHNKPQQFQELNLAVNRSFLQAAQKIEPLKGLYRARKTLQRQLKPTLGTEATLTQGLTSKGGLKKMLTTDTTSVKPMLANKSLAAEEARQAMTLKAGVVKGLSEAEQAIINRAAEIVDTIGQKPNWGGVGAKQHQMTGLIRELEGVKATFKPLLANAKTAETTWIKTVMAYEKRVEEAKLALYQAAKADPRTQALAMQNALLSTDMLIQDMEAAIKEKMLDGLTKSNSITPEARKLAQMVQKDVDTAAGLIGATNSLHPFHRRITRRFLPYFTFLHAMAKLAVEAPHVMPKRLALLNAVFEGYEAVTKDQTMIASNQLDAYTPIFLLKDGTMLAFRTESLNPFAGLKSGDQGDISIPDQYNPIKGNVWIRIAMEGTFGPITKKTAPMPGMGELRLRDGSIWHFDGNAFRRTHGATPAGRLLVNSIPLLSKIDTFLNKYVQTDKGWFLQPDPFTTMGGQPKAEIGLMQKVSNFIIPTTQINDNEMRVRAIAKVKQILMQIRTDVKFAAEAKRNGLIDALRRFGQGDMSRILEY